MENTRVFISGLPPTLTNDQLRKHFSSGFEVTDAHVLPNRRIGFVGFRSNAAAQEAVKHFNKTFIRMSKIAVELARPVDGDLVGAPSSKTRGEPHGKSSSEESPLKRKRDSKTGGDDPALQEYLSAMRRPTEMKTWADTVVAVVPDGPSSSTADKKPEVTSITAKPTEEGKSEIKKPKLKNLHHATPAERESTPSIDSNPPDQPEPSPEARPETEELTQNDADWLRSKTSRLLGLLDEEEEEETPSRARPAKVDNSDDEDSRTREPVRAQEDTPPADEPEVTETPDANISLIRTTGRLFLRNLPYTATESDFQPILSRFGKIGEIHIAFDTRVSASKGFAYVQYVDPESAIKAYQELDGKVFQGRLLHILPASSKKTYKLDEYELSKLPHKKQQQVKKRTEAGAATFSWNALYMNTDAVMSSVAARLGVSKADILDPTSSDAAIKQAHAETHVIQETKAYFSANGVNLDSFKQRERGNTAILVKNFSYGVKAEELRKLFEPYGQITRLLMPPSGTIAIIQFALPDETQRAFKALAYRKLGDSILFLEKAPKDLFEDAQPTAAQSAETSKVITQGFSTSDTFNTEDPEAAAATSTLFVRNLNFTTTNSGLAAVFEPLEGFLSAKVKTKPDPKRPGERLSMGFGFVEFRTRAQAQAALAAMNGYKLDQHELVIKASHKAADAAEERRQEDKANKIAARRTKIIIKNLPFQATKKDIQSLFGSYGKLRSVRVPQKFDRSSRGFAFADFVSAREAENAMDALRNTHLLGRRLVLEFASADAIDPEKEIEKIENKVDAQVNRVKLKQLTGSGRKKFRVDAGDEDV